MADIEENSYTRALHQNKSPDHSLKQIGEETSQCTEKRSVDSAINERNSEMNFVERIISDQDIEQCLVHSRPSTDLVGSMSNESNVSSNMKSPDTPDTYKISERSCSTFDGSASIKSNVSSEMNMTTEPADDAFCCHTFRYDESWSVHSGTISNGSDDRADSPISVFAPATSIEFGTSDYIMGGGGSSNGVVDVIKTDSTLSGLTTTPSVATETLANSIREDNSFCIDAETMRDSREFKEGTEVNLDEFPLLEEDEDAEDDIVTQAADMDTVETEDAHFVEYVEEVASSDVAVTMVSEQGQSKDAYGRSEMLEEEGYQCAPRNTQVNLLEQTHCEEDITKTSFIKKLLPKQRLFIKKRNDGISNNEPAPTFILQMNDDVQRESDEFEMICASSEEALVTATVAAVGSEPPNSNNQATKKTMIPHVRSHDTDSTKDTSVFTMRSVNSESTEASGGALAGMFSLGVASFQRNKRLATSAASAIEDSSLYLHEEVLEDGEVRGDEQAVLAHESDFVDESLNVEMNEDDYINSPHYSKAANSEQASTKVHKISILPRLTVFSGKNSLEVKSKDETIAIEDSLPQRVSNNDGAQKTMWNDVRMKMRRWKTAG